MNFKKRTLEYIKKSFIKTTTIGLSVLMFPSFLTGCGYANDNVNGQESVAIEKTEIKETEETVGIEIEIEAQRQAEKEEMERIDDLLEEEDANKPFALQKEIALSNKKSGRKEWKFVDFDKGGKETILTSEIKDVDGDEEFLDNKIFKKKIK